MFARLLIVVGSITLLTSMALARDPPEASGELGRLQQQVRVLQAQLDMARAEATKLRKENAALQEALKAAKEATPEEVNDIKTYKSVDEILLELPEEMRPDPRKGWENVYQVQQVNNWLSKVPVGNLYQASKVIEKVNQQVKWTDVQGKEWSFSITLSSLPHSLRCVESSGGSPEADCFQDD